MGVVVDRGTIGSYCANISRHAAKTVLAHGFDLAAASEHSTRTAVSALALYGTLTRCDRRVATQNQQKPWHSCSCEATLSRCYMEKKSSSAQLIPNPPTPARPVQMQYKRPEDPWPTCEAVAVCECRLHRTTSQKLVTTFCRQSAQGVQGIQDNNKLKAKESVGC